MSNSNVMKVAVIGAGFMAREHIRAFQAVEGVTVSGITSRTRSRAEALASEFGIGVVCDSVDELYEKTTAGLVVMTVPELAANAVSKACFQYPWTVLMEKPAGYNMPDAEEIAANAKAAGSKVFVALNRRFYSSTQTVLKEIKSVNSPRFIVLQDQEDPQRALQAGQPKTVVDNWMYANSVHVIDYFTLFGRGEVTSVEPVIRWDAANPWVVAAKVAFDSGDCGIYQAIWNGPGPWSAAINTPEKRWEMRPLETGAYQNAGQRKLEPIEIHAWDAEFKPGLRLMAETSVKAALGETTELPTLEESLKSMRLVKAIYGL